MESLEQTQIPQPNNNQNNHAEQRLVDNYNNFLEQLKVIFPDNTDSFNYFLSENDDDKYNRCLSFVNSFNDEHFEMFSKSKLKVFSHKSPDTLAISSSLFMVNTECKFYLKELLNNQPDQVKLIIWNNLYTVYLLTELTRDVPNNSRINCLASLLISNEPSERMQVMKDRLNEVIGDDVNQATKEMLNDMVECFNKVLDNPNKMLPEMLNITNNITTKYADKINNGEIEIEKVVKLTLSRFPGVNSTMIEQILGMMNNRKSSTPKERVIMDENFSTANVELGSLEENSNSFKLRSLLPLLSAFTKFQKDGQMPQMDTLMSSLQGVMSGVEGSDELMSFANNMMSQMKENGQMEDMMSSLSGLMTQMNESGQMDNIMSMASTMMTQVQETGELPQMNTVMEMLSKQGLSDNPNELLASLQNMMSNASNGSNNSNCNIDMDELLNLTKQ
jgi:hypothetical protein